MILINICFCYHITGGKSKKLPGNEYSTKSTHISGRLTALAPLVDDILYDEDNIDNDYTDFHHSKGIGILISISTSFIHSYIYVSLSTNLPVLAFRLC